MDIQWPLVLFAVLNGAGGWLIAFTAVNEFTGKSKSDKVRFIALVIGIVLVVVAGICSAFHLTHPDRIMGALSHPTSGIFTEALLTGLLALAAIIYVVLTKRDASASAIKGLAAVSGVLGVILPFATGMSYMMAARPTWDTIAFPLACLATTAISGAAIYLLLQAMYESDNKDAIEFSGKMCVVTGAAAVVFAVLYVAVSGTMAGSGAILFWLGTVIVGGVLPAVCGALVKKGNSVAALAGAAVAGSLIGSLAFRCFMWIVGTGILDLIGNGNWFGSI